MRLTPNKRHPSSREFDGGISSEPLRIPQTAVTVLTAVIGEVFTTVAEIASNETAHKHLQQDIRSFQSSLEKFIRLVTSDDAETEVSIPRAQETLDACSLILKEVNQRLDRLHRKSSWLLRLAAPGFVKGEISDCQTRLRQSRELFKDTALDVILATAKEIRANNKEIQADIRANTKHTLNLLRFQRFSDDPPPPYKCEAKPALDPSRGFFPLHAQINGLTRPLLESPVPYAVSPHFSRSLTELPSMTSLEGRSRRIIT